MKTLITESHEYSSKAIEIYGSLGPVFKLDEINKKPDLKKEVFRDAEILVVRNLTQVDKKLIDSLPNLKIVASPTTGINHIDGEYLKKRGGKLICLRGRKSFLKDITSTAEQNMALLFSLLRHLPASFDEVKKGNWPRNEFIGNQLKDKTIGILGYGRLGKIVARYAKAFWMKVISADPFVSKEIMEKHGVKKVPMEKLFKESDVVSVHVLLTPETYDLVDDSHLKLMKKDAVIINTSRGEIFKKDSLFNALKNGWIKGAAIDVMHDERQDGSHLKNDKLWEYAKKNSNLIITPHLGGVSYEAMAATEIFIAELVKKYFTKKNGKR